MSKEYRIFECETSEELLSEIQCHEEWGWKVVQFSTGLTMDDGYYISTYVAFMELINCQ